ncbi:hypothetical protein C1645_816579 [Glomus cerebriforme]|uniref:Uncharacterized protein n=1 Tax=Glomus cerebriforme TaxID=658196 RepID=A0A397TGH7_9GLOM|nr:hypothetical protein C1645_816579 [Glomus cerebriforme]
MSSSSNDIENIVKKGKIAHQKVHEIQEGKEKGEEKEKEVREKTIKRKGSLKEYLRYLEIMITPVMCLHNGNIKIYEVPLSPYRYTVGTIMGLMNISISIDSSNSSRSKQCSPDNFIGVGCTDPNNNNYPPCNMANIPTYLMNISGVKLFNGVSPNLRPTGFAVGFNLDLWELQDTIRKIFNI